MDTMNYWGNAFTNIVKKTAGIKKIFEVLGSSFIALCFMAVIFPIAFPDMF
jgi:hypothetical protein